MSHTTGTFQWLTSASRYQLADQQQWGNQALGDIPFIADMDADRRGDLIVWRASTGTWFWLSSSAHYSPAAPRQQQWGNAAQLDVPLPADLDGDGQADLAVWRPTTGTWWWLLSTGGYSAPSTHTKQWGR